jgi:hypothetical protein
VADPRDRFWIGVKFVERPYSRVPAAGESIKLGDEANSLGWGVDHVGWNNSGLPALTLTFEQDDSMFDGIGAIGMLEGYGFRRLLNEAPPTE